MEHIFIYAGILYLVVLNIIGLTSMSIDKRKAKHHAYRISEKALFLIALLGGAAGSTIGMHLFHHKTKHWYFVIGMPLLIVLNVICCVLICKYLPGFLHR